MWIYYIDLQLDLFVHQIYWLIVKMPNLLQMKISICRWICCEKDTWGLWTLALCLGTFPIARWNNGFSDPVLFSRMGLCFPTLRDLRRNCYICERMAFPTQNKQYQIVLSKFTVPNWPVQSDMFCKSNTTAEGLIMSPNYCMVSIYCLTASTTTESK